MHVVGYEKATLHLGTTSLESILLIVSLQKFNRPTWMRYNKDEADKIIAAISLIDSVLLIFIKTDK